MGSISDISNPWRDILLGMPASFRGVWFHVDSGTRSSGRRVAPHEYPKRNKPYMEDMGRSAVRISFTGYLIYKVDEDYVGQRKNLIAALEDDDAGQLIHPVFAPNGMKAMVDRYSVTESRERGGYSQFDMSFVDAGTPGNSIKAVDSAGATRQSASNTGTQLAGFFDGAAADLMASAGQLVADLTNGQWPDLQSFAERFGWKSTP